LLLLVFTVENMEKHDIQEGLIENSYQETTPFLDPAYLGFQAQLKQAQVLQSALFQIANLVNRSYSKELMYQKLHEIVGGLMNTENL